MRRARAAACSTSRPDRRSRDRARAARAAGRLGRWQRLRRGHAGARAREGRRRSTSAMRRRSSSGATRSSSPTSDDSFDAATVGFGARNFSDLARAWPSWRASCARADAWSCSRSPRRSAPRCRASTGCGSTASCPRSAGSPGARLGGARARSRARRGEPAVSAAGGPASVDRRRLPLSAELGQALPRAAELAAEMERAGLRDVGYMLTGRGHRRDPRGHRPARPAVARW